jgi:hypothetical protein
MFHKKVGIAYKIVRTGQYQYAKNNTVAPRRESTILDGWDLCHAVNILYFRTYFTSISNVRRGFKSRWIL